MNSSLVRGYINKLSDLLEIILKGRSNPATAGPDPTPINSVATELGC